MLVAYNFFFIVYWWIIILSLCSHLRASGCTLLSEAKLFFFFVESKSKGARETIDESYRPRNMWKLELLRSDVGRDLCAPDCPMRECCVPDGSLLRDKKKVNTKKFPPHQALIFRWKISDNRRFVGLVACKFNASAPRANVIPPVPSPEQT